MCYVAALCMWKIFFWKNINSLRARLVISKYMYLERGWLQTVLLNPTGRV